MNQCFNGAPTRQTGLAPIAAADARVLILGTMPGVASLQAGQYYAHPRNAFWPMMAALFEFAPDLPYPDRQAQLVSRQIAVWDVLSSCRRAGSLDGNIALDSLQVNDFADFYARHPAIARLFFNGAMAEKWYRQKVCPGLAENWCRLPTTRLPSTSPAHAALGLAQKISAWQVVRKTVENLAEAPVIAVG